MGRQYLPSVVNLLLACNARESDSTPPYEELSAVPTPHDCLVRELRPFFYWFSHRVPWEFFYSVLRRDA